MYRKYKYKIDPILINEVKCYCNVNHSSCDSNEYIEYIINKTITKEILL